MIIQPLGFWGGVGGPTNNLVYWVNNRVQLVKLERADPIQDVMTDLRNIEPTTIVLRNQQSQAHILVDRTEEEQDIFTMLLTGILDTHTVVLITPERLLLQIVLNVGVQPVGRSPTTKTHPGQVDIRNESTKVVWQPLSLSHVTALIVKVLAHYKVSPDNRAGKLGLHSDQGGQSQVSIHVEHQRQACLQHWTYILITADNDAYLLPISNFHDGIGTVEDHNPEDQFRVSRHHNHHVVHQGIDADLHINQTHAGPVQGTGQVLNKVQNTYKIQVMKHNLTKYKLPTYCSGSIHTLAQEDGLSQALCETIEKTESVNMQPNQDGCQSPGQLDSIERGHDHQHRTSVVAKAWSPPESSHQDTACLYYTGSNSFLSMMITNMWPNGGFRLDLLSNPVPLRAVQTADQEYDKEHAGQRILPQVKPGGNNLQTSGGIYSTLS
jgi:hypothetical protein